MMAERVVAKGGSGYLVFSLGRDNYAIEVEKVKEVIKAVGLTPGSGYSGWGPSPSRRYHPNSRSF